MADPNSMLSKRVSELETECLSYKKQIQALQKEVQDFSRRIQRLESIIEKTASDNKSISSPIPAEVREINIREKTLREFLNKHRVIPDVTNILKTDSRSPSSTIFDSKQMKIESPTSNIILPRLFATQANENEIRDYFTCQFSEINAASTLNKFANYWNGTISFTSSSPFFLMLEVTLPYLKSFTHELSEDVDFGFVFSKRIITASILRTPTHPEDALNLLHLENANTILAKLRKFYLPYWVMFALNIVSFSEAYFNFTQKQPHEYMRAKKTKDKTHFEVYYESVEQDQTMITKHSVVFKHKNLVFAREVANHLAMESDPGYLKFQQSDDGFVEIAKWTLIHSAKHRHLREAVSEGRMNFVFDDMIVTDSICLTLDESRVLNNKSLIEALNIITDSMIQTIILPTKEFQLKLNEVADHVYRHDHSSKKGERFLPLTKESLAMIQKNQQKRVEEQGKKPVMKPTMKPLMKPPDIKQLTDKDKSPNENRNREIQVERKGTEDEAEDWDIVSDVNGLEHTVILSRPNHELDIIETKIDVKDAKVVKKSEDANEQNTILLSNSDQMIVDFFQKIRFSIIDLSFLTKGENVQNLYKIVEKLGLEKGVIRFENDTNEKESCCKVWFQDKLVSESRSLTVEDSKNKAARFAWQSIIKARDFCDRFLIQIPDKDEDEVTMKMLMLHSSNRMDNDSELLAEYRHFQSPDKVIYECRVKIQDHQFPSKHADRRIFTDEDDKETRAKLEKRAKRRARSLAIGMVCIELQQKLKDLSYEGKSVLMDYFLSHMF